MLRMEITFNTGKIQKENVLKIEDLYLRLDQAIHALGLKKVDDGVYEDNGNKEDLTKFFAVISWLKKSEWFRQCVIRQYVIRWNWYNDRFGTKKVVEPENLLEGI